MTLACYILLIFILFDDFYDEFKYFKFNHVEHYLVSHKIDENIPRK